MRKFICSFILLLGSYPVFCQISVDDTKTFLQEDGKPFFWLGDTAWELFHRLSREEAVHYLDTRQRQGFNLVMAVALAELDGIRQPNFYGDTPFEDRGLSDWEEPGNSSFSSSFSPGYWDHVDYIISEAAKRGIYIGLLPAWGDKVVPGATGPVIFKTSEDAYAFAKKLAERYAGQRNIVWILGGDRSAVQKIEKEGSISVTDFRPIWRGMAKAIQEVCGEYVFIAYHPNIRTSEYFSNEDLWLSLNAVQSGHGARDVKIWDLARRDLGLEPKRPFMDMEPCYEDHPVNPWDGQWTRGGRGYFTDYDVRARIYRGIFAGGCGAVYGHHSVWQFLDTLRNPPVWTGDTIIYWKDALLAEGAYQMKYLKNLMMDYPDFHRVEDSLLIASNRGTNFRDKIIATRNIERTYAFIYLPQSKMIQIDLDRLKKGRKNLIWMDPASGERIMIPEKFETGIESFDPPETSFKDWVLIIETESLLSH